MGKLTRVTLLTILHTMIQDENFVESLTDCITRIFDIGPPNSRTDDPFDIIVDRIVEYFAINTEMGEGEIPGLRSNLMMMFKEKQFVAFARVLNLLQNLFGYSNARVMNYLKQLKLREGSVSGWIDVRATAEAVVQELDPNKLKIFAQLSDEGKCLLQGFTSEQIAVLSKFSPRGTVMLSKLGSLPPNQRTMILGLDREESSLFQNLGYDRILLLSGTKLVDLEEGEIALRNFIARESAVIRSMTEEAGNLAGSIHQLTVEERENYLNLSPREVDILNNLNDDYRNTVLGFTNLKEVLNVAKNLHPTQRDLILSLRQEEIDALLETEFEDDFHQIRMIASYGPELIKNPSPLPIEEQHAILELNQHQRLVLREAYDLGRDGLFMVRQLGPEPTRQVLNGKEELTVMQTALKKKLTNMNFNENILSELFGIMEHELQAILLDLSWKGIQLLSKTSYLDERMIDIVENLSDDGMVVLINNDQLTGTEISMLGILDASEGNFLMNLNLDQRHYLSDRPDFTKLSTDLFAPEQQTKLKELSDLGKSVLQRIMVLSDNEQQLLEGLKVANTAALSSMDPVILNLFATLSLEEIHLVSSFLIWHSGEDLVFSFLGLERGTPYAEKIMRTRELLGRIPRSGTIVSQHNYRSLIAGAIQVLRLDQVVMDNYVEEIIPFLEGPRDPTTLSLIFKVNLLKFSVRDSTPLESEIVSKVEGTEEEFMTASWFNQIRSIDDLMFVRWILSSSATMDDRGLFQVGRGSLIQLSYHLYDGHKLKALLSKSTSQLDGIEHETLMENFKRMMRADRYSLATCFFFALGRESSSDEAVIQMTKIFVDNFDADECFEFLNTPSNNGFLHRLRDGGLPDMLSDGRFPNPSIFEVCLYYNRGNVLALTEKLDEGQLWKLMKNRPLSLLRIMTRNVQIDLMELFKRVTKVEEVLRANRMEIFEDLMRELRQHASYFTSDMYLYIARGIRSLCQGRDTYLAVTSEYIELVQSRVSGSTLRILFNSLVREDVSREYLITVLKDTLRPETIRSLTDRVSTSCAVMRRKRGAEILCMDSENTRDITDGAEQRILHSVFDQTESTLYDNLLEYSESKFSGEELDPRIGRDLITRIKDLPMDSLDPRIGDIITTLDDPKKFDSILKQSGTLKRIEKVAGATGFAFTSILVGKHITNGDMKGSGYDALNLWIMPKIGGHITEVLEKSYPVTGPVIGFTVANFAAFLGLLDGIIMRKNAVDEIDKDLADLSIVTNAVFIAVNIPAVATRIIESYAVETAVIGELSGPVGVVLSVPIIIGSYLIGAGFEMERVTEHIQLSFREKLSLYWDLLRDHPVPEWLKIDVEAKELYTEYIASHLRRLNGTYDKIALSLPSFSIKNASIEMDFTSRANAKYPFSTSRQPSKVFPENLEGYHFVCGPRARDAEVRKISSQTTELFIPSEPNEDCQNIVSFKKHGSSSSSKTFLYVAADALIDLFDNNSLLMVFHGKNLILRDRSRNSSMNAYHIQNKLNICNIHKRGQNFFYVVAESFKCDLGEEIDGQLNTVVITSNFKDSRGIHSIIGSEKQERIEAHFADFVDGNGGGDLIRATKRTIVKGYLNDFVTGNCTVILPFNISEIVKVVAQMRLTIFNRDNLWLGVDGNARIMTADYYILTPIRISNGTQRVIHAHTSKTFKGNISIEEELSVLRTLKIPNCTLVKQITSANYDIVLSDVGKNVFYMEKNNHEYYWEAAEQPGNLYIFRKMFGRVMISHANGILDFRELGIKPDFNQVRTNSTLVGVYELTMGDLHIKLLPNYRNVKMTYDGKKYYKLGKSGFSRDWCSHTFQITGRVFIDGNDLHEYYNCFEFQSDKIFFLRLQSDLVLVSGKQVLTICKYYIQGNKEIELSVKLKDGKIIEAPGFRERADRAGKVIFYEVGNSELVIYHNQPVDEHHIGYVDLKHRSVKDVEMIVDNGRLFLLHLGSVLVRIENWDNYEPARDMMFAFNDSFLPNAECILADCQPNDIIEDMKIEKRKRSAASSASRGSSWINAIVDPIRNYHATLFLPDPSGPSNKFNPDFCITSNVNLLLVLLQNFLDRISPLPKPPTIATVETLSDVIDLIEEYQGDNDSFQLYSDIVELARTRRYHAIRKIFN